MPAPPWKRATGLAPVIDGWLSSKVVRPCFTGSREAAPEAGVSEPYPETLHPALVKALVGRGIPALYRHQARAFEAARTGVGAQRGGRGRHVVVSTPTASG